MIKILYNNCYGTFDFSADFLAEYKARTGRDLDTYKALFRQGPDSIRVDEVAVAIVTEKGSAWASGANSDIAIYSVPTVFERYWEIEEEDGDETVRVNVAAALADCLETFMETGDRATLDRQYAAIVAGRELLKKQVDDDSIQHVGTASDSGCA